MKPVHASDNVNDSDRKVFENVDDSLLEFLENMVTMSEKKDSASNYSTRVSHFSNALSLTVRGIIDVSKMLLGKRY